MNSLRGKISGTFNSVKAEAEEKAEKLKGDVKDLLHTGQKGIVDIVDSIHKRDDGESSVHLETSIPAVDEAVKEEIATVDVKAAGGVVTSQPSNQYGESPVELDTSVPAVYEAVKEEIATVDVKAAGGVVGVVASQPSVQSDKFSEFFSSIFEKCCAPFDKKKD